MLERYSDDARQAVVAAEGEARRLGHNQVGTEHLLLGLLAGRDTPAAEALVAAGASLAAVREKVVEELASRGTAPGSDVGQLPFTARANRALDRAGRLSLRMGSDTVESDHVLLSVLDVEGTAGQVLRRLTVDPETVRHALTAPPAPAVAAAEVEVPSVPLATPQGRGPVCEACSTPLAGVLDRDVVPLASGGSVTVYYCTVCGTSLGLASS